MLNDLSNDGDRSLKSGIGQGANSIGQVAGILITLPFVNGITLFGEPGRAQALLPATIIFGLLSLPMLIFYKENSNTLLNNQNSKQSSESVSIVSLFKEVFGHKRLALFLVAYFLFSDAMLTFANNFPLYLETVHNVSDNIKSILTASILILATIGAIVFGKIADKKGNIKTLNIILIIYCFIFVIMAFVKNFQLLIPVFLFAGILFGPVWGISRALVGELAPSHLVASSYSYYVVAERFATFVGPMVWSIALIIMGDGIVGYQTGLLSLMALLVFGIFILNKIRNPLNP
jgi:UMF1 family MFS transporter